MVSCKEQLHEARKRTERLINVRDRSSAELRKRLREAGFTDAVVEEEVEDALSLGLIDDERFTRLYVQGKKRSGWGQNRIEVEIRRYGIELRYCEGYPESFFTEEEELRRAQECLSCFHSAAKNRWAAQYRRLISKGFSTGITLKALRSNGKELTEDKCQ